MSIKCLLSAAALGLLTGAIGVEPAIAQVYYYRVVPNSVVVSTATTAAAANCAAPAPVPTSAPAPAESGDCNCDPAPTGECKCKPGLQCRITLPPNCHKHSGTNKPIETQILGSVPRVTRKISCYDYEIKFEWETEVPQIVCQTETCVEIDTKKIACMPDCEFDVCVPVVECCDKVEKCELTPKVMKIVAKRRRTGGWDIYVINDPNPASPYHAGGMPDKWLIYHCLGADRLQAEFPGQSFAANETPKAVDQKVVSRAPAKSVKPAAMAPVSKAVAATPKAVSPVKPAPTKSVG